MSKSNSLNLQSTTKYTSGSRPGQNRPGQNKPKGN
jgi:hypothetical protein